MRVPDARHADFMAQSRSGILLEYHLADGDSRITCFSEGLIGVSFNWVKWFVWNSLVPFSTEDSIFIISVSLLFQESMNLMKDELTHFPLDFIFNLLKKLTKCLFIFILHHSQNQSNWFVSRISASFFSICRFGGCRWWEFIWGKINNESVAV